ncbi:MAG: acyl-CoA dehydrogenase family protein [Acidimicrobiales bacterium]
MAGTLHPDVDSAEAVAIGLEIGRLAAPYAATHDLDGTFVAEGYEAVRKLNFGHLAVPKDLGGYGQGLEGMCRAQAAIAKGCASTSLAIAMHSHAVLTMAWRRASGDREAEGVLRRVVEEGLVLSASGTLMPSAISIDAEPAGDGYLLTGRRRLVSGAPGADFLVSAARLHGPSGPRPITVLAPLEGKGVTIVDDWDALGMRGSGTNSVRFDQAFAPAKNALYTKDRAPAIVAPAPDSENTRSDGDGGRPSGLRLPGLAISLPIIGSVYLGLADAVFEQAVEMVAGTSRADNPGAGHLTGVMVSEIRLGWWALEGMVRQTTDASLGTGAQMVTTLVGKRQMVLGAIRTIEAAMELLGSATYLRGSTFERALRDARAGITHPAPPEATLVEVGWEALEEVSRRP